METQRSITRIAMLSVHTCPLATLGGKKTGGMNVYVRDLSREFARRGIMVDIYTRSQDPCQPHINDSLAPNARVIHVPAGPESPLDTTEVYPYLPQFVQNVSAYAAQNNIKYDIIFSHYWLSGWAAHQLRSEWQVPVAQMFHTLGHMKNRIAQIKPQIRQMRDIRVFTETDIMSWADALIAATPAERAQMLWLYQTDARKIHIVPPGVDTAHFHPMDRTAAKKAAGILPEDKMFLFVGRIERLKGVDNILQAIALIKKDDPALLDDRVCIAIIGGNPDETTNKDAEMARLQTLREQLAVHDLVTFIGAREQDRLRNYYNAAEALIMPSDYESFGMVALEAMACGTPVIASEVGGLAYLIRDGQTGFHVPVREPQALADRMTSLLNDPKLRAQMSQEAFKAAQAYHWSRIADQLLAVFTTLPPPTDKKAILPAVSIGNI
ncbi:glycosyltransferase [Chloroflexota bacterium]